jgi:hypothetical protein
MATNIVGSAFPDFAGLLSTPRESLMAAPIQAAQASNQTPMQAITGAIQGAGAQLQQGVGTLFGQVPARVAQQDRLAAIIQQVQSTGVDVASVEGQIALAQELSKYPEFIGMATAMRQQAAESQRKQAETEANIEFKRAQAAQMTAKAEMPMKEDISPQMRQYRELVAQGLSPAEARRIAYNIKETAGGEEGPKVGFSKSGAFTNQFGETIPATEMSKNRTGFQSAERLLGQLNSITDQDIRNAEAVVDYTQSEARKAVGGTLFSKTLDAQTKIAASQLLQQIEALPPGSASDADMRTAAREFPGYSDATALRNWVNRTKATLEQSLARQAEQFGFQRRITATAPVGPQGRATATTATPSQPIATKRFNPATGQLEDIR